MTAIKYNRGSNTRLTAHFKRCEFDCKCGCKTTLHDPALSKKLERLREQIGAAVTLTSGYRCKTHNAAVGGSSSSYHVKGQAADIKSKLNPVALAILARQYFNGVGLYWHSGAAFVHVDTRIIKATWLQDKPGAAYRYTSKSSFILPTIKRGSSGEINQAATRMLQRLLGVTVDGVFGFATDKALRAAQRKAGITVDGICGPDSWRHISGAAKYL